MRRATISVGLAAALLAVAAIPLPDETLAASTVRKGDTKRMGKSNKGTFTPPNPILPPSPIVPPSPVKR